MCSIRLKQKPTGFTIVELLVVIVVIGILAAITIVAYTGIQDKARASRANDELNTLQQAIMIGRLSQNKTLIQITGSNCTSCGVIPYATAIDRISAASQINLDKLKAGDPWGNSYAIDENEGEGATPCANHDSLSIVGSHPGTNAIAVPFYSCSN